MIHSVLAMCSHDHPALGHRDSISRPGVVASALRDLAGRRAASQRNSCSAGTQETPGPALLQLALKQLPGSGAASSDYPSADLSVYMPMCLHKYGCCAIGEV
jgi:hypothetical protein